MDKELVPFWEEAYQNENIAAFSIEPNATIKEFEHLLSKQSKIIDIGCGEGQNAFYLAKQYTFVLLKGYWGLGKG